MAPSLSHGAEPAPLRSQKHDSRSNTAWTNVSGSSSQTALLLGQVAPSLARAAQPSHRAPGFEPRLHARTSNPSASSDPPGSSVHARHTISRATVCACIANTRGHRKGCSLILRVVSCVSRHYRSRMKPKKMSIKGPAPCCSLLLLCGEWPRFSSLAG